MSELPVPLVLIGVGSSFALSALFYSLHRDKKEELRQLKEIPIFKPDLHLFKLLKATPRKRFQYIGVEGLVEPDGVPIASKFVPRCFGVVQKITEDEHWEYWNSITKTWNSRRSNRQQTNNTVPFSLVEPGGYSTTTDGDVYVKVHNPLEATGLDLDRVHYRVRRAAEAGLPGAVLQGLSGKRAVAKEETEELLKVGATLTGFGELVLEPEASGGRGVGVMRLQAPPDGRPYVLVAADYQSYMARHESSASMWKSLSVVCGAVGGTVLAGTVYGLFRKHNDK